MIQAKNWRAADSLTLEPNAKKAAMEQNDSLALTAGPGAGKTEMLAQRADFLLRTGTCNYPRRILAISFKADASSNLKQRVKNRCGSGLSNRFDSYTFHAFSKRIIDRFRPVLTGVDRLEAGFTLGPRIPHKQIDFNDLIPLAIKILKASPVAINTIRQTYTDVFLDEFQDCTNEQYELIKITFQNTNIRLTAVGDTKQKIMGWAGALDGIFIKFQKDFNATPLNMYRNFRSKPKLLRLQNEIIKDLDPTSVMPDEQVVGKEGEIKICSFQDCLEEANYLSKQINDWIMIEKVPASEIAILVKNQPDLYTKQLMIALNKYKIPYRNEQQLQDISVEPAARLVVDFLLSTFGEQEPSAWIRLMNILTPFTDEDYEQEELAHNWLRFIKEEKKLSINNPILQKNPNRWECIKRFITKVGFDAITTLSHDYETEARLRQVLNETCGKIDQLMSTGLTLIESLKCFEDDQTIRILTIHKSKGLEFHSVIMLGIESESYWGKPDENLCLYFVGISRAKERLFLTNVKSRSRPAHHTGRWDGQRHPQAQYLNYAKVV